MLFPILLLDDTDAFAVQLARLVYPHLPSVYWDDRQLWMQHTNPHWAICHPRSLQCIDAPRSLLVFGKQVTLPTNLQLPTHTVAVVDPTNRQVTDFLAQSQLPAISCGFSQKDTLTLSSLTDEQAVISLQRSIYSYAGRRIEPAELPVALSRPVDSYLLLALAAILLFTETQTESFQI